MKFKLLPILSILILGCASPSTEEIDTAPKVKKPKSEVFSTNCASGIMSNSLAKICDLMKSKGYIYNSNKVADTLIFEHREVGNSWDVIESIKIESGNHIRCSFKKIKPIERNLYPKFTINEICLETEAKATKYASKLNRIMNWRFKQYGYVLQNGNNLLIIETFVNRYSFIIEDLKKSFVKIVKRESTSH